MSLSVGYVVSPHFDYSKLVAPDAGPAFAREYGWPVAPLHDTGMLAQFDVLLVDNRMTPADVEVLRSGLRHAKIPVMLRVCDPFAETQAGNAWYRFLFEALDWPHVHYLLTYAPAELTALLMTSARRSQFVFAPYVYMPEHEQPIDHSQRRSGLIISGAVDRTMYPLRYNMRRAAKYTPFGVVATVLAHPGYTDIGQPRTHGILGDAYVRYLANWKFAAVCSSRCRLEFLKYREIAYAGAVPVGDLPSTLLDCPADAWIPWRRNLSSLARDILTAKGSEAKAERFRDFMRGRRDATSMRAWFCAQVQRLV